MFCFTVTETAILTSPTAEYTYVRFLVIFFDSCSEYIKNEAQFIESFRSSVANLIYIDGNLLTVNGISCTTGRRTDRRTIITLGLQALVHDINGFRIGQTLGAQYIVMFTLNKLSTRSLYSKFSNQNYMHACLCVRYFMLFLN